MTQKFDLTVQYPNLTRVSIVAALDCMMREAVAAGHEVEPYFEQQKECNNG